MLHDNQGSRLLDLPSEVIVEILAHLTPVQVAAFAQTSRTAWNIVQCSAHLWRTLYLSQWDLDPSHINQGSPQSKSRQRQSLREVVQQRTRARGCLRTGAKDVQRLILNHPDTLQALIEAARQRQARHTQPEALNVEDLNSRTAASLSSMFPPNSVGDARWSAFVYPREKLTALQVWQARQAKREQEELLKRQKEALRHSTKRSKLRQSTTTQSADAGPSHAQGSLADTDGRRRSARLSRGKIPEELQELISRSSDEDPVAQLRAVQVNEQLAAELHCLHGVRLMLNTSSEDALAKAEKQLSKAKKARRLASKRARRGAAAATGAARAAGAAVEDGNSDAGYESNLDVYSVNSAQTGRISQRDIVRSHRSSDQLRLSPNSLLPDFDPSDGEWEPPSDTDEAMEDLDADDVWDAGSEVDQLTGDRAMYRAAIFPPGRTSAGDVTPGHGLLGSSQGTSGDFILRTRAKEMVYDCGHYAWENSWGPFMPFRDGGAPPRRGANDLGLDLDSSSGDSEGSDEEDETMTDVNSWQNRFDQQDGEVVEDEEIHELVMAALNSSGADGGATPDDEDEPAAEEQDEDEEFEETESEESDEENMFGGMAGQFGQMVNQVGAYQGSKVRNELERLQAADPCFDHEAPQRRRSRTEQALDNAVGAASALRWTGPKRIDWVLLESIMIVVHSNLLFDIYERDWGSGFRLPKGARGEAADGTSSDACVHERQRRLLYQMGNWLHSRGDVRSQPSPPSPKLAEDANDSGVVIDEFPSPRAAQPQQQQPIFDWANVEGASWCGTYFFADFTTFLHYNHHLAMNPDRLRSDSIVLYDSEAVGDCLQLRLNLNPPHRQSAEFEEGDLEALSQGPEDPEFPTLRFRGQTFTYHPGAERPESRGQTHGFVRPIYVDGGTGPKTRYHAATDQYLPEIAGIQWRVTHAYDGSDRWRLNGIQAGPPGTRAPIYGIWSDAGDDDVGSPFGPFVYFNVDSRPWKEVEKLLEEETRQRTTTTQAS